MNKPTGYSLVDYAKMITDRPRMTSYLQALRQVVSPGCVVVDIGAGTGIFSLLACQLGAGHVHAIEPNDAIAVARDMGAANGYADRITFHQAISSKLTLPGRADVIISDLRGVVPLFENHIPTIVDARRRFLRLGGALIPRRDTLWAALIEDPDTYRLYVDPWISNDFGLNMQAGHNLVVNTWMKVNAKSEQVLVDPQKWVTLDYESIENPDVDGELSWKIECEGTAHGLIVWFDTVLAGGIGFSNAPGKPKLIYGQAFFPLQVPLGLIKGDRVSVRLAANLSEGEYVWRWETSVFNSNDDSKPRSIYRQSTFYKSPIVLDRLHRLSYEHVPTPSESAQADCFILSLFNGQNTLGEIAQQALARFPSYFPRWEDALSRAGELAEKYRWSGA